MTDHETTFRSSRAQSAAEADRLSRGDLSDPIGEVE